MKQSSLDNAVETANVLFESYAPYNGFYDPLLNVLKIYINGLSFRNISWIIFYKRHVYKKLIQFMFIIM